MVTDTIISALTNLFALFCSRGGVDKKVSAKMLETYLGSHFSIRNKDQYIKLYQDLRELYEEMPGLDIESIVDGICTGLKSEIRQEEGAMVFLRLLEFCSKTPESFNSEDPIFTRTAHKLGITKKLFGTLVDFVSGYESRDVKLCRFEGFKSPVKTLWLRHMNLMIFSYDGSDIHNVTFNDVPIAKGMYQVWDTSGVLKNRLGKPVYYSMVLAQYHAVSRKGRIIFTGRDIDFHYPHSRNGLHGFSFDIHDGELIAIMGGSGSGKTTLVSILNGSITPQRGTVKINGYSLDTPEAKALIGFVPQDDLLIEELTVYQNLYYTARLCFAGMSEGEISHRVNTILKDLGLYQTRDLKVGSPIKKIISGGQRKRLNIALELIREPAVLLLDEPTSGLSSADTENVISLLKEQSARGKLIVTNIHQPSSDVYKLFDRLWILDKGGYPVYDGNPIEAITYFKTAANYADAETSTCPVCGNVNPEVLLNIIEEKALDSKGQITDERKVTPERWHEMYLENREAFAEPKKVPIPSTSQHKPGVLTQWWIFVRRNVRTKVTNLQYLAITFLATPLLALVCAFLTRYAPPDEEYALMTNKNFVSYLFMSVIVATFVGMTGSAEEIIKDRALLKREKFLQLSYHSYIWSKIGIMAVVSLAQTLLFIIVGNSIIGATDLFCTWWAILFLTAALANLTGLLLSQNLSSVVSIYITIPILLIPQILLCGLVVNFSDLTPKSTTGNVPLIGNIIPSRWAYEALAVESYTDNDYEREFFELDKVKYESQYYRYGLIYQLQSANESDKADREQGRKPDSRNALLLRNELPYVATVCQMADYAGGYDYASVHAYLDSAEEKMIDKGNRATLLADQIMVKKEEELGRDGLLRLKQGSTNTQLESQLAGHDAQKLCDIIGGRVVPRAAFVYITPRTKWGNAPFYSSEKRIGETLVPTLWYNLGVMTLMCFITILMLLHDVPGRYVRK